MIKQNSITVTGAVYNKLFGFELTPSTIYVDFIIQSNLTSSYDNIYKFRLKIGANDGDLALTLVGVGQAGNINDLATFLSEFCIATDSEGNYGVFCTNFGIKTIEIIPQDSGIYQTKITDVITGGMYLGEYYNTQYDPGDITQITTAEALRGIQYLKYTVRKYILDNNGKESYILSATRLASMPDYGDLPGGQVYFYTTGKRTFFQSGTDSTFYEADGVLAGTLRSGITANRPTVATNSIYVGFVYFDTTLGRLVVHTGSDVWIVLNYYPSITDDGTDVTIDANLGVSGQAHSGNHTQTFAASTTFNANNGTNQYMLVTGDCTINISNLNVGVMTIKLKNSGAAHTITIGSSFGDPMDDIAELKTADGDTNTIMVIRGADNTYEYTINGRTV